MIAQWLFLLRWHNFYDPLSLDPIFPCFLRKATWPVFFSPFNIRHQINLPLLGALSNTVLVTFNSNVNTGPATQGHVCFSHPVYFPLFSLLSTLIHEMHWSVSFTALHLIHSLHSSPCLSPSFPLLWVHLCSNFLKRASRPSHPFHLGRIHLTLHCSPHPPLEPGATWRSSLRLWPHLRNEERPTSSGGAEMRRSPLVAAWRVSRKVLRAGRDAEPWQEPVGLVVFTVLSSL